MVRWAWRATGALVVVGWLAAPALASAPQPQPQQTPAPATDVRLSLGSAGHIGAWLLYGALDRSRALAEGSLSPNAAAGWRVASAADGPIDVAAALDAKGKDLLAYAGGVLHVRSEEHTSEL